MNKINILNNMFNASLTNVRQNKARIEAEVNVTKVNIGEQIWANRKDISLCFGTLASLLVITVAFVKLYLYFKKKHDVNHTVLNHCNHFNIQETEFY